MNPPRAGGAPPAPVAPFFVTQPSLPGSTALGSTVTVSLGSVSGVPYPALTGTLTRPGKSAVAVLDGYTFQIEASDQGGTITLDVTATNSAGSATARGEMAVASAGNSWNVTAGDGSVSIISSPFVPAPVASPSNQSILIGA